MSFFKSRKTGGQAVITVLPPIFSIIARFRAATAAAKTWSTEWAGVEPQQLQSSGSTSLTPRAPSTLRTDMSYSMAVASSEQPGKYMYSFSATVFSLFLEFSEISATLSRPLILGGRKRIFPLPRIFGPRSASASRCPDLKLYPMRIPTSNTRPWFFIDARKES